MMFPKENAIRSEPYRRLVAAMPCKECGIRDYSQAAHPPPNGKAIKQNDLDCFPLCCTRPGVEGCHPKFDQYKLYSREEADEKAAEWGRETRAEIIAQGLWPKRLPLYVEKDGLALVKCA